MSVKSLFSQPDKFTTTKVRNPATAYDRAKEEVDRMNGTYIVQAYNWRRISIGLLIMSIILTAGLVIQSLKTQVIPYVVTVDKNTGEVLKAGTLTTNDYKPQEAEIKYFLGQFVSNARSIGLDPVVYKTLQTRAASYLTQNAAQKYVTIMQSEGRSKLFGQKTVVVHISSIQKMPNTDTSFQIRWTEEELGIQNGEKTTKNMSGIFSYTTLKVEDKEQMLVNPLGLFITDFSFSEDITATSSGGGRRPQAQNQQNTK